MKNTANNLDDRLVTITASHFYRAVREATRKAAEALWPSKAVSTQWIEFEGRIVASVSLSKKRAMSAAVTTWCPIQLHRELAKFLGAAEVEVVDYP